MLATNRRMTHLYWESNRKFIWGACSLQSCWLTGLFGRGAQGADAGADERGFVVGRKDLDREALQRAHADHGFEMGAQQAQIEEVDVVAGEVKAARPGDVDEGGGGGGQRAVPHLDELAAAGIAFFRLVEDLFRLH